MKRGDVAWLDLEIEGRRPVCVLTRDVIALDNLRTVPKAQLTEPIVILDAPRLHDLCRALNAATGCA